MSEATAAAGTWNADEEYWKVREGKKEIRAYSLSNPEHAALLKRNKCLNKLLLRIFTTDTATAYFFVLAKNATKIATRKKDGT